MPRCEHGADGARCSQCVQVRDPSLVRRCADRFGTQCIVVASDAQQPTPGRGDVFVDVVNADTSLAMLP